GEQGKDGLAVGNWRRGGHVRSRVASRVAGGGELPLPQFLARLLVVAQNVQPAVTVHRRGGAVDPASGDYRVGQAPAWQIHLPAEVLVGTPLDRQASLLRHGLATRAAELRPVGGQGRQSDQGRQRHPPCNPHHFVSFWVN